MVFGYISTNSEYVSIIQWIMTYDLLGTLVITFVWLKIWNLVCWIYRYGPSLSHSAPSIPFYINKELKLYFGTREEKRKEKEEEEHNKHLLGINKVYANEKLQNTCCFLIYFHSIIYYLSKWNNCVCSWEKSWESPNKWKESVILVFDIKSQNNKW